MSNPIANLTKKEWWVWICSLFVIIASNFLSGNVEVLTLAAASLTMLRSSYYAVGYAANDISVGRRGKRQDNIYSNDSLYLIPHSFMASRNGRIDSPTSLSAYSTRGGTSA